MMTLSFGKVVARTRVAIGDTTNDPDDNPDLVNVTGDVTLTPTFGELHDDVEGTILPSPIAATFVDGYLVYLAKQSIWLISNAGFEDVWNWHVDFTNLRYNAGVSKTSRSSFNFDVPVWASEANTVDLNKAARATAFTIGSAIVTTASSGTAPSNLVGTAVVGSALVG